MLSELCKNYLAQPTPANLEEIIEALKDYFDERSRIFEKYGLIDNDFGAGPSEIKISAVYPDAIGFSYHWYEGGYGYDGEREETLSVAEIDNFDSAALEEKCRREKVKDLERELKSKVEDVARLEKKIKDLTK